MRPNAEDSPREAGARSGYAMRPGANEDAYRRGVAAGLGIAGRLAAGAADAGEATKLIVLGLTAARELRGESRFIASLADHIEQAARAAAVR